MNRQAYRPYPLRDALLFFQPSSGHSLRIDAPWTRGLQRGVPVAPRVVFFGLSHRCNLRCGFCSRDAGIEERWRWEDAFGFLRDLAAAGTQEVAFGGGEPLAYKDLLPLLEALHEQTPLALHLTTNGTLLTEELAAHLAPFVQEIRISIYEDTPWTEKLQLLQEAGIARAANVIVTPENVFRLPSLLCELAALGCSNVALLRYLGDDEAMHLQGHDWAALENAVHFSPLPVRLSRCFSDQLPGLPRLLEPGPNDCGAGDEFVVIDPDRKLRPCSFHEDAASFADASEFLQQYQRARQTQEAAPRKGCPRLAGPLPSASGLPFGLRSYQGFASNNSGDTVLVARFESEEAPAQLVEELGLDEDGEPCKAWQESLSGTGINPTDFGVAALAIGKTLLATGYDADDGLPGLRQKVTESGGLVTTTAIHIHDAPQLVVATPSDEISRQARRGGGPESKRLWDAGASDVDAHDGLVFGRFTKDWFEAGRELQGKAFPFAAELVVDPPKERLVDTFKRPHADADPGYFQAWFPDHESAAAFVASFDAGAWVAGCTVLVKTPRHRPRLAKRAAKLGGIGQWLPASPLGFITNAYMPIYKPRKPSKLPEFRQRMERALPDIPGTAVLRPRSKYNVVTSGTTTEPGVLMNALQQSLEGLERLQLRLAFSPQRPLALAVRRLRNDLVPLRQS